MGYKNRNQRACASLLPLSLSCPAWMFLKLKSRRDPGCVRRLMGGCFNRGLLSGPLGAGRSGRISVEDVPRFGVPVGDWSNRVPMGCGQPGASATSFREAGSAVLFPSLNAPCVSSRRLRPPRPWQTDSRTKTCPTPFIDAPAKSL